MRVLLIHNSYGSTVPSGENAVFAAERKLLEDAGHEVHVFVAASDTLAQASLVRKLGVGATVPWSARAYWAIRREITRLRPAVAHVHNTFPMLSPAVLWACRAEGLATVMTLHNFRIACAPGLFFREGRVCEDCVTSGPLKAVKHACYRGSRAATLPLAASIMFHQRLGTWRRAVTRFIAMTEFGRHKAIEMGLPADRIRVKPHFIELPPFATAATRATGTAVFVGRLAECKGTATIADAWRQLRDVPLTIIGEGPERQRLEHAGLEVLGQIPRARCIEHMARASMLVMPSLWYETFGLTIAEAFACGTPVIASRLGVMAEHIIDGENGLLFTPGSSTELAARVRELLANPDRAAEMGRAARRTYEARFTPEANLHQLLAIYEEAVADCVR